jgi:hypothetical protein
MPLNNGHQAPTMMVFIFPCNLHAQQINALHGSLKVQKMKRQILELVRPPFQSGNNVGIISTRGLSHLGACAERSEKAERAPSNLYCENTTSISPQVAQPAADEGSRTGLKGSLLTGLLHDPSNAATPAGSSDDSPFSARPPKIGSRNAGTESMPLSRYF